VPAEDVNDAVLTRNCGRKMSHCAAMPAWFADTHALSQGTIKKIDKAAGRITIAHGRLENLAMPAITMTFKV
jgi:Cu(I)/Ag(I) efflux system periplasmic protein CusF